MPPDNSRRDLSERACGQAAGAGNFLGVHPGFFGNNLDVHREAGAIQIDRQVPSAWIAAPMALSPLPRADGRGREGFAGPHPETFGFEGSDDFERRLRRRPDVERNASGPGEIGHPEYFPEGFDESAGVFQARSFPESDAPCVS